jgi:hypothetical protein
MAAMMMNVESEEIVLTTTMVCDFIEQATSEEMAEILKATGKRTTQLLKHGGKVTKRNVPTGVVPAAFAKNGVWVEEVMAYASQHGWNAFPMKVKGEMVEMDGSMENEVGTHVFSSSGKALSRSQGISLAKHWKDSSEQLWLDFDAAHASEVAPKAAASKPAAARISQAEMDAKKAEKEAQKAELAAAKKAEREAVAADLVEGVGVDGEAEDLTLVDLEELLG